MLSRALQAAGLEWDANEAHSALYDAERTAQLFCMIVNRWKSLNEAEPALNPVLASVVHPSSRTSTFERRSRSSTTSAFRSEWFTRAGQVRTATSKCTSPSMS